VTITVHPAVKYTCLFDPDHICIGTPTFFKIIITSGTPPFDITYNDGIQNVTLIGITANPVLIPVVPTAECLLVYTVIEISDAWNCKNDIPQSATLFIESKPTFDIIPCNSQIPDNQILNVFNLTTSCRAALFYDYVWTVNNIIILQGNGVTVIPPITVSPPVTACLAITAWYPPQGSSNNNILCSNTEYCDYLNMTDCIIEVPDAFTPNNDGINDRLILVGDLQFFTKVELLIFNRQGKLIYEFVSVNDSWDGKWEEIPQESDIYAFQLKAFCINGEVIKKNGSIVLIR
jgi:gliding motility-associated-like protein